MVVLLKNNLKAMTEYCRDEPRALKRGDNPYKLGLRQLPPRKRGDEGIVKKPSKKDVFAE